nr:MAG TPA: hypothetical protein [Caudoviricetes sp.]
MFVSCDFPLSMYSALAGACKYSIPRRGTRRNEGGGTYQHDMQNLPV